MDKSDQKLLIQLDANFTTFVKQYKEDMKELKDGTTAKIVDHETRLRSIETLRDQINPQRIAAQVDETVQWKRDFSVRWRTILWIVGGASSIVTFTLTILAFTLNLIK